VKVNIKWKFYLIPAAVFVGSLLALHSAPVGRIGSVMQDLAGVPLIGSLCYALYQLVRDRTAYERSLTLLELQDRFSIGATSHMAIVAFDKHVEFSEEYVSKMFEILTALFIQGPRRDALEGASSLLGIRQKFSLWMTPQLETDLEPFEAALRKIGSLAHLLDCVPGGPGHQNRVETMYKQFAEVLGSRLMGASEWEGRPITEEVAMHTILRKLRKVLGVEELTDLRASLVSQALQTDQQR
jgi:hypothetical protein